VKRGFGVELPEGGLDAMVTLTADASSLRHQGGKKVEFGFLPPAEK
jgi:hypothetical protein